MRILAILLIVLLLGRPRLVGGISAPGDSTVPTALVVAVDNSGSMGYRVGGRTHLAAGKAVVQQFVEQLPPGSRVAVLSGSDPAGKAGFLLDRKLIGRMINDTPQENTLVRVSDLLGRAAEMVRQTDLPRKAVLLVNDRTATSWAGLRPGDLAEVPSGAANASAPVEFYVMDCWEGTDTNTALGAVRLGQEYTPVGIPVPIQTTVRGGPAGGEAVVRLFLGDAAADQAGVRLPAGGGAAPLVFHTVPRQGGLVQGSLRMDVEDPLAMDNVRYFTLSAEDLKLALLVRDDLAEAATRPECRR